MTQLAIVNAPLTRRHPGMGYLATDVRSFRRASYALVRVGAGDVDPTRIDVRDDVPKFPLTLNIVSEKG
jgi:hypothetical protein